MPAEPRGYLQYTELCSVKVCVWRGKRTADNALGVFVCLRKMGMKSISPMHTLIKMSTALLSGLYIKTWDLGSLSATWQSEIMSDFCLFLSYYHGVPTCNVLNTAEHILQASLTLSKHTQEHFVGQEPHRFTSCWSRASEQLRCWWRVCTRPLTPESAVSSDWGNLENGLLPFLSTVEKYLPAQCAARRTAHQQPCTEHFSQPNCEMGNSQLSLKRQYAFLNQSADAVTL